MTFTEKHKQIYNCFLKHFRNGEPFQPRKDFDSLDQNTAAELDKIYLFFEKFPHINWNDFFGAPRFLHPEEKCPHLGFFLTRAAIKAYNLLKNKQELRNPKHQLDDIREGMKFIGIFCIENKIPVSKYLYHKDGLMHSWMKHYREHNINPYCLMEMGDILSIISSMEPDEREIYIKELAGNIGKMKIDYFNSEETKKFVKKATKKIGEYVNSHLQSTKDRVSI